MASSLKKVPAGQNMLVHRTPRSVLKHCISYRCSFMASLSLPPELVQRLIEGVQRARYVQLSALIVLMWDYGEPTSGVFN